LEPAEYGGLTALQQAVRSENMQLISLLLEHGADVNAEAAEDFRYTALQAAIEHENLHLAQYLIGHGADVNAPASSGETSALELAASAESSELLRLVLDSGMKDTLQWRCALGTAIMSWAATEVLEILLSYGFDINENPDEDTPILVLALEVDDIFEPCTEDVMLLLKRGAGDLDEALLAAASAGDIFHINLLLDWGADANAAPARRKDNMTALSAAASKGHVETVELLLTKGASDFTGALQAAAGAGSFKLVEQFLRLGANVDASIPDVYNVETTALERAATSGNVKMLRLLLDAGAKVDCEAVPRSRTTALQCAAMRGNLGVVDELLQRGADVNAPPRGHFGRTALEGAAENGRLDIVQLLINVNADVGSSRALEFAREAGHEAVVELLERL
jgi:ankyrin repeat protein